MEAQRAASNSGVDYAIDFVAFAHGFAFAASSSVPYFEGGYVWAYVVCDTRPAPLFYERLVTE